MSGATQKRILIMDDSPLFLEVADTALREAGYQVHAVSSLVELEAADSSASIDLVLMDVQMPEAYGDDVAMILRAVRGIEAPIYLLSSLEEGHLATRAHNAGIDGFISKHVGVDRLVSEVDEILRREGNAQ